ncbi:dipicolinate synthase subunit DpsA [Pseudoflavonifractor phocaeensis]|uniref:dipicolinate synthase subunit DpsA n=1 Tax=Pseudoflavonifractor phocaeensis TaxID=1870988 RepID=UPI001F1F6AAD|nr:dipicolinate synthase subunit DpsA [Pseudoflavonifractor phocaeensis]MCF2662398.1 dipicolinate synthase subunit DpsA [Pseudoflavonifractor phocaeensis]
MKHELNFWVVGGDMRQVKLAQLLSDDGHTVHTYALDPGPEPVPGLIQEQNLNQAGRADCVVLPLTVSTGGGLLNAPLSLSEHPLAPILDRLVPRQFLCGGRIDPETEALARERGLIIHDYFAREELAVANAVPTAEGAVQLAMEHLPITIHGSRVLVVGFGRVGRITAQRFAALGAKVSVAARKYEQLAWAQAMGFGAEELGRLAGWLCGYDLVVNTVPAPVLNRPELEDLKPDCLILDLASKPGGVDLAAAGELGLTVIWALSLPGKVAPVTAGAAIRSTIYNMLRELGR